MKRSLIILACALYTVTFFTGCKKENAAEASVASVSCWYQGKDRMIHLGEVKTIENKVLVKTVDANYKEVILIDGPITKENISAAKKKLLDNPFFKRISYSTVIKVDGFEIDLPRPKTVDNSVSDEAILNMLDAWLKFTEDLQTRIDNAKKAQK